ncbi:hypothetical protein C0V82_21200 (plasmid) [Niveispirillum cyanobacteriorum]|uniref:Uncharacterized protein n=1 Tax=Niveispirillum cyanobacteriorum TaxID=1612173 RepID=A0A2K9NIN6_9PROT|nr:hypothetical protein C0V82_21200 [Niveispirillum cyanobacteriorum]
MLAVRAPFLPACNIIGWAVGSGTIALSALGLFQVMVSNNPFGLVSLFAGWFLFLAASISIWLFGMRRVQVQGPLRLIRPQPWGLAILRLAQTLSSAAIIISLLWLARVWQPEKPLDWWWELILALFALECLRESIQLVRVIRHSRPDAGPLVS